MVFLLSSEAWDRDGFVAVQGQLVERGRFLGLESPALSSTSP